MTEGVASAVFGKLSEFLVAPIVRHISYPFCYNSNIKNLRNKIEALENIQSDVQLAIDAAKRNLEVIGRDAEAWLTEVDNIKIVAGRFLEGIDNLGKGCLNQWDPKNLKKRYSLSRKAVKQTKVVMKLQVKGNMYTMLSYPAPQPQLASASTSASHQGGKGYESRISITKEVINALKDDQINMIGICGMAGVGKTRMTREVRGEVKAETLFDEVAIAVVSGNPNLINIQDQLAEMLGLEYKAKTNVVARADLLRERLLHDRNLVILDDVWDVSLDLEEIGLPVGGASKTCKFIFTSRSEQVCTAMGAQRNFQVQVLSDQEAWHLFKEMSGNCVENSDIMLTAKSVAKECGGLPLAIEIVGKALNNKKEHVWKDALEQLRKSSITNIQGLHKLVYSRIELSYNYLESEQAKKLLLLCCQFPEDCDIPTEYLVRYGVGLHLFEDVDTLAAARNRVDSLVDKLRSCYLLISGDKGDTVKLHDVVRDACLSIAARGELCYMVRHDYRSKEWLHLNGLDCPNLNLLHLECRLPSKQENEWPHPTDLHSPDLKLLWLENRPPKQEISGNIFSEMKELRVVCFNDMLVKPLPPSFQVLMNLQTLCLEFCVLGTTGISLIGCLRKLEILSFYGSCLPVLPSKIRQLSFLKLLDLRCESGPRMIPKGVLSGLSKLEELYMGDYFQPLDKEKRDEGYLESITDINSLPHLTTLQLRVDDHMLLLKLDEFCYKRLNRFYITEAWELMKRVNYRFSRSLELYRLDANWVLESKMTVLLKKTDYLLIQSEDLKNLVKEFNKDGFVNLKILHMYGCDLTEYVIDAYGSVAANITFINLESLNISNMGSLKEICRGDLPAKSFARLEVMKMHNLPMIGHLWKGPISPPSLCNLRVLKMKFCHLIKGLFPESVVKCLVQLQKLSIRGCKMLEEIVVKEGIPHVKDGELVEFPKLRYLKLVILPSLVSFDTKGDVFAGAVEPFFNQQVC